MELRRTFEAARDRQGSGDRTPSEEIGLILDQPPVLVEGTLGSGAQLTERWRHSAVHDSLPPMFENVIMTYYGEERAISLQGNGRRIVSRTRPGTITIIPSGSDGKWDVAGPLKNARSSRQALASLNIQLSLVLGYGPNVGFKFVYQSEYAGREQKRT